MKEDPERIAAYEEKGVQVLVTRQKDGRVDLADLMEKLGERKIDSILLEGGAEAVWRGVGIHSGERHRRG